MSPRIKKYLIVSALGDQGLSRLINEYWQPIGGVLKYRHHIAEAWTIRVKVSKQGENNHEQTDD